MIQTDAATAFLSAVPVLAAFVLATVTVFVGLRFLIDWVRAAESAA